MASAAAGDRAADASARVIWVYGAGEDGIQAFTDFGIENLIELIRSTKRTLDCSGGNPAAYDEWIRILGPRMAPIRRSRFSI